MTGNIAAHANTDAEAFVICLGSYIKTSRALTIVIPNAWNALNPWRMPNEVRHVW